MEYKLKLHVRVRGFQTRGLSTSHDSSYCLFVYGRVCRQQDCKAWFYVPFEDWSFSVSHKRILYSDPSLARARCVLYNLKNGLVSIKQVIGSHQSLKDNLPKTLNSPFSLWLCDLGIKTQLWTSVPVKEKVVFAFLSISREIQFAEMSN